MDINAEVYLPTMTQSLDIEFHNISTGTSLTVIISFKHDDIHKCCILI